MIHFALCDDNKNALDKATSTLNSILTTNDIDADISYATTSADKLLKYVKNNKIDALLLDIDLSSNISGIDVAKQIRKINKNIYIIFLTAHFEYSMIAYKVKTFDYLVKPISYAKLEETILRLMEDINENKNLFVKIANSNRLYRADDIIYIEKSRAKAIIHTSIADFEIYGTMDEVKSCLPEYFIRCNKSYIINTQKITQINSKNRTICIDKIELKYSPRYINDERMLMFNERIIN